MQGSWDITTYLRSEFIHLLRIQARICEHTNLGGDVAPVVLAAELLKVLLEERTHGDDAVGHVLDLAKPLLVQRGVVQDLGSNTGTVNRGVRVERSHEDLDLRINTLLLVGGLADDGEGTNTLAVESLLNQRSTRQENTRDLTMFFAKL